MASSKAISQEQQERLEKLAAMPEQATDTSDIPEVLDWSDAMRGGLNRPLKEAIAIRLDARWTGRGMLAPEVVAALRKVRRDAFVDPHDKARAYVDAPLPIGHGQTISQPFIVALMTDLLELRRSDRVLEIGTGSGYQAAVLAELAEQVCSVEVIPALAERARRVLGEQGYGRVALRVGDGALGWPERAPFDAIIVTAAAREVPPALLAQLAPGGRLAIPVGAPNEEQELRLLRKRADGTVDTRTILPVAFVPLVDGPA